MANTGMTLDQVYAGLDDTPVAKPAGLTLDDVYAGMAEPSETAPDTGDLEAGRIQTAGGQAVRGFTEVFSAIPKNVALQQAQDAGSYGPAFDAIDAGTYDADDGPSHLKPFSIAKDHGISTLKAHPIASYWDASPEDRIAMRKGFEETAADPREHGAYKAGEAMNEFAKDVTDVNPEYEDEFWAGKVSHGMGQMAGFMTEVALTRGKGPNTAIAVAGSGAMAGRIQGFEDAMAHGASIEDAYESADLNGVIGITEALPITRMLDRLDQGTGGLIKRSIRNAIKEGTEEALQEAFQTVMSNYGASDLVGYDADRELFDGGAEGAGVGFTTGALTAFLTNMVFGRRGHISAPVEAQPVEQPAAQETEPDAEAERAKIIADGVRVLRGEEETHVEPVSPTDTDVQPLEQPVASEAPIQETLVEEAPVEGTGERDAPVKAETPEHVDIAAQQAETAPSEAQIEAGNYKKGHVKVHGLDIAIENPQGSVRSGTDESGNAWETVMGSHYGYLKATEGADADGIDVFVNTDTDHIGDTVYIVDQVVDGEFDEHKVVMGANSQVEAEILYSENYDQNWDGLGAITPMTMGDFKAWLKSGNTKKPVTWTKPAPVVQQAPVDTQENVAFDPEQELAVQDIPIATQPTVQAEQEQQLDKQAINHLRGTDKAWTPFMLSRLLGVSGIEARGALDRLTAQGVVQGNGSQFQWVQTEAQSIDTQAEEIASLDAAQAEVYNSVVSEASEYLTAAELNDVTSSPVTLADLENIDAEITAQEQRDAAPNVGPDVTVQEPQVTAPATPESPGGREDGPQSPGIAQDPSLTETDKAPADNAGVSDSGGVVVELEDGTQVETMTIQDEKVIKNGNLYSTLTPSTVDGVTWYTVDRFDAPTPTAAVAKKLRGAGKGQFEAEDVYAADPIAAIKGLSDEEVRVMAKKLGVGLRKKSVDELKGAIEGKGVGVRVKAEAYALATEQRRVLDVKPTTEAVDKPQQDAKGDKIEDFGEKIGGARKDTARKTGPRGSKPKDERPAWMRRYETQEIVSETVRGRPSPNIGKHVIHDKRTDRPATRKYFDTEQEALDAIPLAAVSKKHKVYPSGTDEWSIERNVTDKKRVTIKDGFATREDAMEYLATHASEIMDTKTRIDDSIHPALKQAIREGDSRRENGRNVVDKDFMEVFGFRGIEFGKWNNQAERQHIMDQAYDALLDMAELLGVPPKAISLNGELAVGFGSRGHGLTGAMAHYERDYGVINLTKIKGAGSLAHEWLHSFDHYLGRQAGKAADKRIENAKGDKVYDATTPKGDYVSHGFGWKSKERTREELKDAFDTVMDVIQSRKMEYKDDASKRERIEERQAGELLKRVDQFRKEMTATLQWGHKKYRTPANDEQLKRVDVLLDRIREGDYGESVYVEPKSKQRMALGYNFSEVLVELSKLHKEIRGKQGYGRTQGRQHGPIIDLHFAIESQVMAKKFLAEAKAEKVHTKKVRTEYYSEAWRMDQGSTKDYWSTPHELAARAFGGYIYDKLKGIDARNDFLSYEQHNDILEYKLFGVKPFPEGAERTAINNAFDNLFNTIKHRETDKGVELFRVGSEANNQINLSETERTRLAQKVVAIAQRIAPTAKVETVQQLFGIAPNGGFQEVQGLYRPAENLIKVSLSEKSNPEAVVRHEAIHALKDMGLFSKTEWNLLSNKARRDWMGRFSIERRYSGLKGEQKTEEAIAEAFADYQNGGTYPAMLRRIFDKIAAFFERLRNALNGMGYQTVDDVFTKVERGTVGKRRPQSQERAPQGQEAYSTGDNRADLLFARQLDQYVRGELKSGQMLQLGDTPAILQALGARKFKLVMSQGVMKKIALEKHAIHTDKLASLPSMIAKPMMVLRSQSDGKSLVVMLKETDATGAPLIATVHISGKTARVNAVSSVYGKNGKGWFARQTAEGRLLYINKKESPEWLRDIGIQYPKWSAIQGQDNIIMTEDDFVKSDNDDKYSLFPEDEGAVGRIIDDQAETIKTPGQKKAFLKSAFDGLKKMKNDEPLTVRNDLKWATKAVIHPRTIASIYPAFAPVWAVGSKQFHQRDLIASELTRSLKPYHELSDADKAEVHKVLEIGRLQSQIFSGDKIEAVNKLGDGALTEKGDIITLTAEQSKGYAAVRDTMDDALERFKEQALREWGFGKDGDPSSAAELENHAKDLIAEVRRPDAFPDEIDAAERGAETAKKLAEIIAEIERSKKRGYLPLTRYGNYGLTVRDSFGGVVHFEKLEVGGKIGRKVNKVMVHDRRRALLKKYPMAKGFKVSKATPLLSKDDLNELGVGARDIDAFAQLMHLDGQEWDKAREQLFEGSKRQGFRSHFIRSKQTPGYSTDFERSLADYVTGISSYMARREFNDEFDEAVSAISPNKTPKLREYAGKYVEYLQNPKEYLQALRNAAFFMYLGGNISSAAVNLTQVFVSTAPYMTQFAPKFVVAKELTKAYKDAAKMLTYGRDGATIEFFDPSKAPLDVRVDLQEAWDNGTLVPLVTLEMMGRAHGSERFRRGVSKGASNAVELAGSVFTGAERANRIVTFIAAHRLARRAGFAEKADKVLADNALWGLEGGTSPSTFASWAIDETHFVQGRRNRPRFHRSYGTALLQFQGFTWQMLELMYRMAKQNGPSGKKAFGHVLLSLLVFSGLWGLPFAENAKDAFEELYAWAEDEELDLDTLFRELIVDATGSPAIAEVLSRGPMRLTGVDMSRRVGLGDILPMDTIKSLAGGDTSRGSEILGVSFDMTVGRLKRAHSRYQNDQYQQAFAEFLPSFAKNPIQSIIWGADGVSSGKTGRVQIPADEVTGLDVALKFFGFTSSEITLRREKAWAGQRLKTALNGVRGRFYTRLARALADGDREAVVEVRKDIQAYNEDAAPKDRIRLNRSHIKRLVAQERLGFSSRRRGRRGSQIGSEIDRIYGE